MIFYVTAHLSLQYYIKIHPLQLLPLKCYVSKGPNFSFDPYFLAFTFC